MDASYITPFLRSAQNVFETMLQLTVRFGAPGVKKPGEPACDVSGIIGMSGDIEGAVILSFPTGTAQRVVRTFTGADMPLGHPDFADAVGELVNMVSGGAKAQFTGKKVNISCPSVVIGGNHAVFGSHDVVAITVPCQTDCGDFALEVLFRRVAGEQVTAETMGQGAGVGA